MTPRAPTPPESDAQPDDATGAWAHLGPGDAVELCKWHFGDAEPRWRVSGTVLQADAQALDVRTPAGTRYRMADGSTVTARQPDIHRFSAGHWEHVLTLSSGGPHWYGDVTTPPEVAGTTISWTDLELDVGLFDDGSWWLTDVPEFARAAPGYPRSISTGAVAAARSLVRRLGARCPPFENATLGATGYSLFDRVSWSSAQTGDGVAVVDRAVANSIAADAVLRAFGGSTVHDRQHVDSLRPGRHPPRDGLVLIGPLDELDRLVRDAAAAAESLGLAANVRVVAVPAAPLDAFADLDAALAGTDGASICRQVDAAIRGVTSASPWVALSREVLVAGWF